MLHRFFGLLLIFWACTTLGHELPLEEFQHKVDQFQSLLDQAEFWKALDFAEDEAKNNPHREIRTAFGLLQIKMYDHLEDSRTRMELAKDIFCEILETSVDPEPLSYGLLATEESLELVDWLRVKYPDNFAVLNWETNQYLSNFRRMRDRPKDMEPTWRIRNQYRRSMRGKIEPIYPLSEEKQKLENFLSHAYVTNNNQAIPLAEDLLKDDPDNPRSAARLALVMINQKLIDDAVLFIENWIEQHPASDMRAHFAMLLRNKGEIQAAKDLLYKLSEAEELSVELAKTRFRFALNQEDIDSARQFAVDWLRVSENTAGFGLAAAEIGYYIASLKMEQDWLHLFADPQGEHWQRNFHIRHLMGKGAWDRAWEKLLQEENPSATCCWAAVDLARMQNDLEKEHFWLQRLKILSQPKDREKFWFLYVENTFKRNGILEAIVLIDDWKKEKDSGMQPFMLEVELAGKSENTKQLLESFRKAKELDLSKEEKLLLYREMMRAQNNVSLWEPESITLKKEFDSFFFNERATVLDAWQQGILGDSKKFAEFLNMDVGSPEFLEKRCQIANTYSKYSHFLMKNFMAASGYSFYSEQLEFRLTLFELAQGANFSNISRSPRAIPPMVLKRAGEPDFFRRQVFYAMGIWQESPIFGRGALLDAYEQHFAFDFPLSHSNNSIIGWARPDHNSKFFCPNYEDKRKQLALARLIPIGEADNTQAIQKSLRVLGDASRDALGLSFITFLAQTCTNGTDFPFEKEQMLNMMGIPNAKEAWFLGLGEIGINEMKNWDTAPDFILQNMIISQGEVRKLSESELNRIKNISGKLKFWSACFDFYLNPNEDKLNVALEISKQRSAGEALTLFANAQNYAARSRLQTNSNFNPEPFHKLRKSLTKRLLDQNEWGQTYATSNDNTLRHWISNSGQLNALEIIELIDHIPSGLTSIESESSNYFANNVKDFELYYLHIAGVPELKIWLIKAVQEWKSLKISSYYVTKEAELEFKNKLRGILPDIKDPIIAMGIELALNDQDLLNKRKEFFGESSDFSHLLAAAYLAKLENSEIQMFDYILKAYSLADPIKKQRMINFGINLFDKLDNDGINFPDEWLPYFRSFAILMFQRNNSSVQTIENTMLETALYILDL